jgi:hypothetical protein
MSDTFTCSMDGYVKMAADLIELSLFALALIKETYAAILPLELGKSVEYAWDGLVGAGSWTGYAIASLYYFGLEYGYADLMCQYSEYGSVAISYLTFFIDFAG